MKTKNILAIALVALTLAACEKERAFSGLELIAEGMGGNTKLGVNGNANYWVEGDQVHISNGTDNLSLTLTSGGAASAYVDLGGDFEGPFYGVYPASIVSSHTDANYTLTVPAEYNYAVSGGRQNLQTPMVAYTAGSGDKADKMTFRHVTAAINVQVINHYGFTIDVDSIVVSSENHKLNGSVTIADMSVVASPSFDIAAQGEPSAAEKRVKMKFNSGSAARLQVLAGDTVVVQVPVLPVGGTNRFTIEIGVHKSDQSAVKKVFSKTQAGGSGDGYVLGRAQLGYAPATFGGLFKVDTKKYVIIAQGNLQYNKTNGEWSFMTTQYGTVETADQNVGVNYADQNIVSLFGWGTSGWNNGNYLYNPYNTDKSYTSSKGYGYGPTDGSSYVLPLTGSYANSDWGVYNAITNGGNTPGKWRLLTSNSSGEVYYLMSARVNTTTGLTGTNSAKANYIKGTVGSICGLILFPDNYAHPADAEVTYSSANFNQTSGTFGFDRFVVTLENWYKMEAAGAVFLPAAGYRDGSTVMKFGEYGCYWSATQGATSSVAYLTYIVNDGYSYAYSGKNRYWGCSVRLVHDVPVK